MHEKKLTVLVDTIEVSLENFLHNFCTILKDSIWDISEEAH